MSAPAGTPTQAEIFRRAAPARVGAYLVFLATGVGLSCSGVNPLPVGALAAVTAAECAALACCYRRAQRSRRAAAAFFALEAVSQTALLYLIGDLRLAVAPFVYAMQLINPGLRLGRRGYALAANGCALLFVLMVLGERGGWLAAVPGPALTVSPALAGAAPVIVWICLNVSAGFCLRAQTLAESTMAALAAARDALRQHSAELEGRVQARTAELEASYRAVQDRTQELRTFIYTVAHDLKNPVNAVLLTADLVLRRDGAQLAPSTRADVEAMARLAGEAEDMIRDLLEVFRIASTPEPSAWVDLDALVRRALDRLAAQISAKRTRIVAAALPSVWGQPNKLARVVDNLLSNAVKYVRSGSGAVDVCGGRHGDTVWFAVADNGIGIAPPYHLGIFRLFGRVPAAEQVVDGQVVGGTGVGLAIVKRIVETHGGCIQLESALGAGSRFTVELPARDTAPA